MIQIRRTKKNILQISALALKVPGESVKKTFFPSLFKTLNITASQRTPQLVLKYVEGSAFLQLLHHLETILVLKQTASC